MEQWDKLSTSDKIDAPVVVNPEIVSNSASGRNGISFVNTNGIHPNKLRKIQLNAVVRQPSFK